jgi:hypothetical protein
MDKFEYADSDEKYGDSDPEPGKLLTEKDEAEVAKEALKIWEAKDDIMKRRIAQWEVNELRRAGWKNVQLRQETDDLSWKAWMPPNAEHMPDALSAMNKAASLCRKYVSIMLADPPAPLAVPTSGEDEDRDAAEFATRVLEDLQSPAKLNTPKNIRRAFDRASTYGSGFIRYYIHPTAGGKKPIEISCGPLATSVEDALIGPDGQPWPELTTKFVMPDGTLTDIEAEAATKFIPGIKTEILTGKNVRFIPHTAEDISEADGLQVATFRAYGEIRKMFGLELSEEEEEELFRFQPKDYKHIASKEERRTLKSPPKDDDEKLVFVLTTYYKACDEYPKGVYVVSLGNVKAPIKTEWVGEDSDGKEISLMLPLAQFKQWAEGTGDPYGFGMMDLIGEGNEIRAHMIGALMDHIDWMLSRKIFLPITGTITAKDLRLPGRTPIPIMPGMKPEYENIPGFPVEAMNLIGMTEKEMENDTSLGQVAQGLESSQVQSGRHAQAILSQVHAGLSEIRQNLEEGYIRASQIELQLVRVSVDSPTRIGWVGEDGAYKERRWTASDLRQTTDVRLKPGSLSMLSPIQKAALAEQYAQFGIITQEDLRDMISGELGGTLGLQDDAFVLRVRRQLATWLEGPPEGWQPQFQPPPVDPNTGQPALDPATGQPMQQVQVADPVLLGIWRPYPCDELPYVARTRLREIAKVMSKSEFAVKPQEWQFGVFQEYGRMNAPQQGLPGQQVGQPPNQAQSPAQRTQGPMAPPDTPAPTASGSVNQPNLAPPNQQE